MNERGALWQAEKLTGNRAQKGSLPGGEPRWTCVAAHPHSSYSLAHRWHDYEPSHCTDAHSHHGRYEVKWKGSGGKTYEPANCLIGWEILQCTWRFLSYVKLAP